MIISNFTLTVLSHSLTPTCSASAQLYNSSVDIDSILHVMANSLEYYFGNMTSSYFIFISSNLGNVVNNIIFNETDSMSSLVVFSRATALLNNHLSRFDSYLLWWCRMLSHTNQDGEYETLVADMLHKAIEVRNVCIRL